MRPAWTSLSFTGSELSSNYDWPGMKESVDVAIVGAGQAGLATSWYLKQAGVDHVVLEAKRVAETWRSRRWDSFCLVTPNWSVKLPGATYAGPDPDGFMSLAELIDYFEAWATSFDPPVEENSPVTSVEAGGDGFLIALASGSLKARSVVVATGAYQEAHRPAGGALPARLHQVLAEDYRNPAALPPGAVLVVGSAQTGCQLAEEIHDSGRTVYLSCGRSAWTTRRIGDRDFVRWSADSGFLTRSVSTLPSPASRLIGNIQSTGSRGGHDLHYRTLHARGVNLVGHYEGADESKIYFADDVATSVDFGDARLRDFWKYIEAYCIEVGRALPEFDWPEPFRIATPTELEIDDDGLGTVIWASGYRPDYGWVKFPVFDKLGFPDQKDGRTAVPGLYFMGVHFMRNNSSTILYGVGEDAEVVARQIVEDRT
jgi:putative flavoprotein involved in K+ transport